MIQVAVMGYGTIGSGVVEVLDTNKEIIKKKTGQDIGVKYILDLREYPGDPHEAQIVHDFSIIEKDEEVGIVVEAMGGVNPAYAFAKACLLAGKHVVTSNKALVAAHGTELLQIARDKKINFLFEASVGGGIPIIRPLSQSLAGEKIVEISGILNGTTNYILTKMNREGQTFEEALKKAQELGYAERNPEADVEGYDTCRKISILTALATGKEVDYEKVYTEGITRITDTDFKYAIQMGTSVKLLGSSRMQDGKVTVFVCPVMVDLDHPLYSVNDVFNAVMVNGSMVGTLMFYGSGAGKLPTASAVVADIMEAAVNMTNNVPLGWTKEQQKLTPMDGSDFRYFIRFSGKKEEKEADVRAAFGAVQSYELPDMDEFAVLTGVMTESRYQKVAAAFTDIRQMIRAQI
ncbi:MAG: homoserine dehydrogenase [Clostridium sp.]